MSTGFKITDELVKEFFNQLFSEYHNSIVIESWNKFLESKQQKKLFTTEDNVDIFQKDIVWAVRHFDFHVTSFEAGLGSYTLNDKSKNVWRYFSTEQLATEWVLYNKPLLSLNEIKQIGKVEGSNVYFERLIVEAKNKL